jgi:hypothetical protein
LAVSAAVIREPTMQIRVAIAPQSRASTAATGVCRHASAVAIEARNVTIPGTQVAPTRVMASINRPTGIGNGDSFSGSIVGSMPVAISGIRNQPIVRATPPITTVACWIGCG